MKSECCVLGCSSSRCVVPVHNFPKDPKVFAPWKAAVHSEKTEGLSDDKLRTRVVCYRHFKDDDYIMGCKYRRLRAGVIPSIALPACTNEVNNAVYLAAVKTEVLKSVDSSDSYNVEDEKIVTHHVDHKYFMEKDYRSLLPRQRLKSEDVSRQNIETHVNMPVHSSMKNSSQLFINILPEHETIVSNVSRKETNLAVIANANGHNTQNENIDMLCETIEETTVEPAEEICRLCAKKSTNHVLIFGDNDLYILEKISRCLPIIVLSDDGLPPYICKRCLGYLNISYKLIVTSVQADASLRNQFEKASTSEEDLNILNTHEMQSKPSRKNSHHLSFRELKRKAIAGPAECEFCDIVFEDISAFDNHMEAVHMLQWRCNICDNSFDTSSDLISHKTLEHNVNIDICKACVSLKEKCKHENESAIKIENKCHIHESTTCNTQIKAQLKSANLKQQMPTAINNAIPCSGTVNSDTIIFVETKKMLLEPNLYEDTVPCSDIVSSNAKILVDTKKTLLEPNLCEDTVPCSNIVSSNTTTLVETKKTLPKPHVYKKRQKKILCEVCKICFHTDRQYAAHRKLHDSKRVMCVSCRTKCSSIYNLFRHKRDAHNMYKKVHLRYVCDKCGRLFATDTQWEAHKGNACPKNLFSNTCKYCKIVFPTNKKLKWHLNDHMAEMLSDPTISTHKCVTCSKVFLHKEYYQMHMKVHDPDYQRSYKCSICSQPFETRVRLRNHQLSVHEDVRIHPCDMCMRTFQRLSTMKIHRWSHFRRKCTHCGIMFASLRDLRKHIRNVHGLEPDIKRRHPSNIYTSEKHVCRYCGKLLSSFKTLMYHEHIHTGERPYDCKICHKTFPSSSGRWAHMQYHENRTFICEYCGKCFRYKAYLTKHIKTHLPMTARKHQCDMCDKTFLRKCHLNMHKKVHDDTRPYTCDICQFSFKLKQDLKRHAKRHTNGSIRRRPQKYRSSVVKHNNSNKKE